MEKVSINDLKSGDTIVMTNNFVETIKRVNSESAAAKYKDKILTVGGPIKTSHCCGCTNVGLSKLPHCNSYPMYVSVNVNYKEYFGAESIGGIPSCNMIYERISTRTKLSEFINKIYEEEKQKCGGLLI